MPSELKFTTDHRFRLVDTDPKLPQLFAKKSLIGDALDEYVVRECLPAFLQHTVEAFKGIEIKRFPVTFLGPGNKTISASFSLKPVFDRNGAVKNLKGSIAAASEPVDCLHPPQN